MLLKDFKIIRPKTTKIQRKDKYHYVYQVVDKIYKADKKYTIDSRVCIGKMIDDDYMIPNEKFVDFYPDLLMSEVEPPALSDTLKIGMFFVVQKVMNDLMITQLLDEIFDDTSSLIIDLVSYMISHESCTFQYYPQFMRNHPSLDGPRSDSYISTFLKNGISDEHMKLFLKAWNIMHSHINCVYVGYDSTNFNTYSRGIELAHYGHPKVDEGIPQINLSYVVNQEDSTPLFYELYDGSVIDKSQCSYMVESAHDYGYENIGFLLDRGYCSRKNIEYMDKNNYEFILMMMENQEVCKTAISEVMYKLKGIEGYYLAEHEVCGATVKGKLFSGDKKTRYFHVYYDDVRAAEERKVYMQRLVNQEKEIHKKIEKKISRREDLGRYEKAFILKYDDNGYLEKYKRNSTYIDEKLKGKGYFVIVTSEEMETTKVLDIYRGRDNIEKMFRSLKSGIDFNKARVHTESSLQSKVFITFIAMIVRNEIFEKLEELRKRNKKDYTVPAVINELENIEVSRNNQGKYMRRYALNAKQKRMLSQFEITEKYIDKEIQEINKCTES